MRKLYSPPIDSPRPQSYSKLPQRILLLSALAVAVFLFAFVAIPGSSVLFIHFWVYLAIAALVPVLLLAALTVKLFQMIRSKWPRYITTWCMVTLILFIIVSVSSVCMVYTTYGETPVSYYTHNATGNRLVIMKYADAETLDESDGSVTYVYSAYPMINKLFYRVNHTQSVSTGTGVDYVEWSEDGSVATVFLTDVQGQQQTIEIDFAADES